jgi:hypothetical protein
LAQLSVSSYPSDIMRYVVWGFCVNSVWSIDLGENSMI